MKGERQKYSDMGDDESYLDFFIRHTYKESYHNYKTSFNHLSDFMRNNGISELHQIDDPKAEKFCVYLNELAETNHSDLSKKTAEDYARHVSTVCSWFVQNTSYLDYNVFEEAINEVGFEYDDRDTKKRDLELDDLRQALRNTNSQLVLLVLLLMLKTGLRIGEVMNLKYKDINLDHPISRRMPEPSDKLSNSPDSLFVDSSRTGNKKRSYREVPIDPELKRVLVWYISMCPPLADSNPPLVVPIGGGSNSSYSKMSKVTVKRRIIDWAKQQNLWEEANSDENVTSHWCRHWWTTRLRSQVDSSDIPVGDTEQFVKGLRGDSGEVIDTYTHEWDSMRDENDPTYREVYCDALPSLLQKPENPTEVEPDEPWDDLRNIAQKITVER